MMTSWRILRPMLLISVASGFTIKALDYRRTVKPLFAATNLVGKTNVDRREALSALIIAGGALVGDTLTFSESRNDNTRTLGSVTEALNLIESECDRRFLHGVVFFTALLQVTTRSCTASCQQTQSRAGCQSSFQVKHLII